MTTRDTRERLIAGTLETIREEGLAAASARTIAAHAGVNQALVFYHFDSVDRLVAETCRVETTRLVALYRERFAAVRTLRELLEVGRALHAAERENGDVAVLAQMLAASATNPTLQAATADALRLWIAEIAPVVDRIISSGPLEGLVEPEALAQAIAAAFIGLELVESVDPGPTTRAFDELERLGLVAEAVEELGPVARRAVRRRLSRAMRAGQ